MRRSSGQGPEAASRVRPIPREWENAAVERLELWLRAAETVRGERASGPLARVEADTIAAAETEVIAAPHRPKTRTFRFPGGRYWTVAEWFTPDTRGSGAGAMRRVLRFASGTRSLELVEGWPADWASLSDEELAALLARSFPRETTESLADNPQRRATDQNP